MSTPVGVVSIDETLLGFIPIQLQSQGSSQAREPWAIGRYTFGVFVAKFRVRVQLSTQTNTVNIASHLPKMAKLQPKTLAVAFPRKKDRNGKTLYDKYTFKELDQESDCIARGLIKIGIGRGMRTVLMVKPSLDFFALTFAIFKVGAIPILVDPGMGLINLKQCLAEAKPEAFIGITKAHVARKILGWARSTVRILVTVGRRLFWSGYSLKQVRHLGNSGESFEMDQTSPNETAAILFTSGSTGAPKGAVYTHGNFAAQVEALRKLYDIQPGEIDLPTFPLFALFDPALGMSAIIPDMDATRPGHVKPQNILNPIKEFKVTNMFGSPALIRRVGIYGSEHNVKLPSLKRVISAGAPVPSTSLKCFSKMLEPGVQIFTPYGATESLPVCSIGSDEILNETGSKTDEGAGVCVGKPVDEANVSIIKITEDPIERWSQNLLAPKDEVGEIVVQGPMVTREYFNRKESTLLAKISNPENGNFYHRMGDLGYFDEKGRLWFCGRKTHRVVTSDETLFTIPCEAVFNTHKKVFRSALVGIGKKGAQRPVLCVELKRTLRRVEQDELKKQLIELGASFPHTKNIKTILFHPSFPVDIRHNAKIFREKLAVWAEGRLCKIE